MTKYKKYFKEMMEQHKDTLTSFKKIHDNYIIDPQVWREKFNLEGAKVVEIIREYEKRLCAHSEGGQFGKFSSNLADKFWQEVRKFLPQIDFVGTK